MAGKFNGKKKTRERTREQYLSSWTMKHGKRKAFEMMGTTRIVQDGEERWNTLFATANNMYVILHFHSAITSFSITFMLTKAYRQKKQYKHFFQNTTAPNRNIHSHVETPKLIPKFVGTSRAVSC